MTLLLNTQFVEHGDQALVEALVGTDALGEGHVDDFVVAVAHHHVALSLHNGLDGADAGTTGQDTVTSRRTAAALQVAEDGDAHVEAGEFVLHTVSIVEGAALGTLRDDDDARLLVP